MKKNAMPGTILPFAVGLGVGAAVALLFAPKAGEELRNDISEGVNDGVNQIRSTGKELKRKVQRLADAAQDQVDRVQDAIEAGETAYSQASKKS
jgi:gas vesicle protein